MSEKQGQKQRLKQKVNSEQEPRLGTNLFQKVANMIISERQLNG